MKISFHLALLPTLIIASFPVAAADTQDNGEHYTATLPTVSVVGQSDTSVLKGYINYDEAAVTRNGQLIKETPQTIDTLNIQEKQKLRYERFEFHPRRQCRHRRCLRYAR